MRYSSVAGRWLAAATERRVWSRAWQLFGALVLAGCAWQATATHEPMMAPDGQRAMLIQCPRSRSECLAEASSVCPEGYAILDQESQTRVNSNVYGPGFYSSYRGEMVIRCRRHESAEQ